jgi:hypothetical protein
LKKQFKLASGKIRRFWLIRLRKDYVDAQIANRQGECNHCGNCCEILFKCPFLITLEDASSQCSIYEDRPGQCAAFPIDVKDLSDVDFDCTYTFGNGEDSLVEIEPSPMTEAPGTRNSTQARDV